MNNDTNNFGNPMMNMFGTNAQAIPCTDMTQQNMMNMFMQNMMQMMQGQMPQMMAQGQTPQTMMIQFFMQMMQMFFGLSGQLQSSSSSSVSSTPTCEGSKDANNKDKLENEYLTVKQTAKLLHVNEVTLWRWHKSEKLMHHKVGNSRILYKREDVYNYINSLNNN